jgi:mannonate dehydratase
MRLGLKFGPDRLTEDNLRFAVQMGVTDIVVHGPRIGDHGILELPGLEAMRDEIEAFDLNFLAIENLPGDHMHPVVHATPERDAQLDKICTSIENLGTAGIEILGYYFSIAGVSGHWRAYDQGGGRGDAGLKSWDIDRLENRAMEGTPVSVEQMWERMACFLERVVPVAEASGVRLAAHQDDPPVDSLFGAGRLLTSHDAMQRLIDLVPSPSNGLEFCQGTVAEMDPATCVDAVRRFAGQGKIFYVHFRNVRGRSPKFDEVFIDEGEVNMIAALKAYRDAGYDGVITPDHTPRVIGDETYGHRGRAFALGYIRAGMQAVERLG